MSDSIGSTYDPILERALKRSLEYVKEVKESTPERLSVRARRLRKKIQEIIKLEERDENSLTNAERAKIGRRDAFETELDEVQKSIDAAEAEKEALERVCEVQFDNKFACPICSEVMEAAVKVLPCKHAFCRACIETTLDKAVRNHRDSMSDLVLKCPICRSNLYDNASKRVHTRPARSLRKRISKASGTCHCGRVMPLSTLRSHLRECGSDTLRALYGEKPSFGNERFRQPDVDKIKQSQQSYRRMSSSDYDEEAALQAALVESMRTAGLVSGRT